MGTFDISRPRACLGMPTDGGRRCGYVALTLMMISDVKVPTERISIVVKHSAKKKSEQ